METTTSSAPARPPKRTKVEQNRNASRPALMPSNVAGSPPILSEAAINIGVLDYKIHQAKKFSVAQAQQEGCLGSYRSFDSPFGNYLVPVLPTLADLSQKK